MSKKKKEVILAVVAVFLLYTFVAIYLKVKHKQLYDNQMFTIGYYHEKSVPAKGATSAQYLYKVNDNSYEGSTTFGTFEDSNPVIGKYYIVAFNNKNPKESIMFLNLEVHDSIRHYFRNGGIDKIPIESYQRTIDSFNLMLFTKKTQLAIYLPPYYKKEDFPELEYLWGEEK